MSLVTVAEVKAVGRIDYSTNDAVLQTLIDGAESYIEERCNIKLSETVTTDERVDSDGGPNLYPRNLPITAVSAIKDAWDDDAVEDSSEYFFVESRIVQDLRDGGWEEGELRWKIDYTAGYTAVSAPNGLKNAIIGLAILAYDNPDGKKSAKAQDLNVSWEKLADGNIGETLDKFSLYRYVE